MIPFSVRVYLSPIFSSPFTQVGRERERERERAESRVIDCKTKIDENWNENRQRERENRNGLELMDTPNVITSMFQSRKIRHSLFSSQFSPSL